MVHNKRAIAFTHPELVAEWHPTLNGDLTPDTVTIGTKTKIWWFTRECAHAWDATPLNKTKMKGCPYCTTVGRKRLLKGFNDLATTHPDIAKEWHPTLNGDTAPEDVILGAGNVKRWWLGKDCGHTWDASASDRARGRGCPYCTTKGRKRVLKGFNDLETKYPEIAKELHPTLNPGINSAQITPHTNKSFWWLGKDCGHEWEATPSSRIADKGCPYCSGRKVLKGFNDLFTTHPEIAKEWVEPIEDKSITPEMVGKGSHVRVLWRNKPCLHEWQAPVYSRVGDSGCPICSGFIVQPGFNDLLSQYPSIAEEWHPDKNSQITPDKVHHFSNKVATWVCHYSHEWDAVIVSRTRIGAGCPYCAGKKAIVGTNDLLTRQPLLAVEWHPKNTVKMHELMEFSNVKAWWQCEQGHEWEAYIYSRSKGFGCPECNAKNYSSKGEKELQNVLEIVLNSASIRTSVRSIIKGELDIYIPEREIAIEFNGLYWHSEGTGKDYSYHARKSQACADKGIHLVHVWEDDWRDRRDIVVRAIAHRLNATERLNEPGVLLMPDVSLTRRYGARTLTSVVITHAESAVFLEANHIQGKANGTLHVGLRDRDGILRAVFVAKRSGNKNHEGEWTIERYATRGIIPGGFTKLMKYAQEQITERSLGTLAKWVTFSDTALSDGGLYRNYGFVEDGYVKPDYRYVVRGERVHKFNYRLKRFREDPALQFEEGLSERELAALNGLHRIWDSGKVRWVKHI